MQKFFEARDNCNENFLFAYHNQLVAGVYIGAGIGKPTVGSLLTSVAAHQRSTSAVPSRTVAQLCGNGRLPDRVVGVSIDATGDLGTVQRMALEWSNGNCVETRNLELVASLSDLEVWDIAAAISTLGTNGTSATSWFQSRMTRVSGN